MADAKKKTRSAVRPWKPEDEGRYHLAMAAMMESRGYQNLALSHYLAATGTLEASWTAGRFGVA